MKPIFTSVGEMQAVAELYQNTTFIADRVLPRVPTATTVYRFKRYPLESRFTVPTTLTGRLGTPNRVQDRWKEDSGFVKSYGLDHPIAFMDMKDAAAVGVDMRLSATSYVTQLVRLDREQRVASMVFNASNYAAGLSEALGAGLQFSNSAAPLVFLIKDRLNQPLVRPNVAVFGLEAWNHFSTNPQIVQAIRGAIAPGNNAATSGTVTEAQVAQLFGLDEVLVGDARINTAAMGATPVLQRVYTDSLALIHRNTSVSTTFDQIITWGYTVEYETIVAGTIDDPDIGLHGGVRVRVGESLEEQLVAPSAGYLMTDCVA